MPKNECSNYHTIALISHASKVMLRPFLAAVELCLVGPPPPPPNTLSLLPSEDALLPSEDALLPSEDVLLPAQPQPAQGASRLHQSPRVG